MYYEIYIITNSRSMLYFILIKNIDKYINFLLKNSKNHRFKKPYGYNNVYTYSFVTNQQF
jgi:hypothetical protein